MLQAHLRVEGEKKEKPEINDDGKARMTRVGASQLLTNYKL